jgi:hypothetical protein
VALGLLLLLLSALLLGQHKHLQLPGQLQGILQGIPARHVTKYNHKETFWSPCAALPSVVQGNPSSCIEVVPVQELPPHMEAVGRQAAHNVHVAAAAAACVLCLTAQHVV